MPSLKWSELVEWLGTAPQGKPLPRADRKVVVGTDTRTLAKGQVFWVLVGGNFDGHDFVQQAFEKGGIAAVV
jgi:UDP-N-acetylmuramyl pentapeptide synthase